MSEENIIWKDVPGYEGHYQANQMGIVKSCKRHPAREKVLKQCPRTNGYVAVNLWKNGKCRTVDVHRVIAATFLESSPEKNIVNHKNGDKCDNRVDNLEYLTDKENKRHAIEVLGVKYGGYHGRICRGNNSRYHKVSEDQVREIKRLIRDGKLTQKEIAAMFNISGGNVSAIKREKSWSHVILD